ncbi:hypothetical protein EOD29_23955 [Mesorhizobium sp. M1A.T.Ca.IN.004.03.1.1]|uniref:hypothetical protein n=1 Tax=Mesorhizobium sp. M1A.T.Ca.IN.004.03.1.1 TaxID=2496795 RepID=UPI000FCB9D8B|nr:hypothetical protein [Mesorhizobium sp. M1A.T.Ca.IN.004.03.1.1]RUV41209.1 hypothetical protein EOD29_23955 [Mesorhizobium sp. M1A.T.Ca.IN.004.03.1.1]
MDIKLVVSDGKRIERVGRILLVLIARHRRACRALEEVMKERSGDRSRSSDTTVVGVERKARHALLAFRATSMIDVAAKAAYVRTLLRDGASGLDEKDWETLLQSFSDHDGY